jgi:hypothetical protein
MAGMSAVRIRVRIEMGAAVIGALLAVLTGLVPDWIEVTGWEPDHHSGAAEWWLTGLFLLVALAAGIAARVELRRAAATLS